VVRDEKPVVLVVDDDPDVRTIYSIYLRAMGCDVFTGNDGRAAVDKAIDLLPDVIVMDLRMPRLDGWEAIRRIRESSWTRQIPIVAVSAVPMSRKRRSRRARGVSHQTVRAAGRVGADPLILKPDTVPLFPDHAPPTRHRRRSGSFLRRRLDGVTMI
jgi:CheY-like chemotaxis protein